MNIVHNKPSCKYRLFFKCHIKWCTSCWFTDETTEDWRVILSSHHLISSYNGPFYPESPAPLSAAPSPTGIIQHAVICCNYLKCSLFCHYFRRCDGVYDLLGFLTFRWGRRPDGCVGFSEEPIVQMWLQLKMISIPIKWDGFMAVIIKKIK